MRSRHFPRIGFFAALLVAWTTFALALPGEVTNLAWCPGTKTCLQWSAVGGATQYDVYRGELASLPCVLSSSLDSCDHGAVVPNTTGSTIPENPAVGRFYWFIVTAEDGSGEGSAGSATVGARQVEDTGACTPSCAPSGSSCSVGADCCSANCSSGTCGSACPPPCLPDDGNQCTTDSCSNGVPVNVPSPIGSPCNQGGGTVCNGSGTCVECLSASQCPGTDTECQSRTCTASTCGISFVTAGTPTGSQSPGDCHRNQCDGSGNIVSAIDNSDVPNDGNQCTSDVCTAGTPSNPLVPLNSPCAQGGGTVCSGSGTCVQCNAATQCPGTDNQCQSRVCASNTCGLNFVAAGTPCSEGGGSYCNGSGTCVQCVSPSQCPGSDTQCRSRTCTAFVCGNSFVAAGTPTGSQSPGDCLQNQCDGSGSIVSGIDNSDVPNDGNQCTSDVCSAGTPSNPPVPINSPCAQAGGTFCSGSGTCVECNSASQCPGTDNQCQSRVCSSSTCGHNFVPQGTPCNEGGGTVCNGAGTCAQGPTVFFINPADGQTPAANTSISVVFTQAMNPSTLTGQTVAGACAGSIQLSLDSFASCVAFSAAAATMSAGDTIATFQPVPGLLVNRTYQIRITTAAQDPAGLPIPGENTQPTGFTTLSPNLCAGSVVISQVYGGGGLTGATYRNDFVELHNRGTSSVSLNGQSIQYAATTGTTWMNQVNLAGTIPAGGYFLIQLATSNPIGLVLPAPDQTGTINMGNAAGKVAYVRNTTALSGSCPLGTNVLDFVGYGAGTNCSEGGSPTADASVTTAATRQQAGCRDSDINGADFSVIAPSPRNSASAPNVCACVARNESNVAGEADYCTVQFPTTLTVQAGNTTPQVFGQVFESGVTDPAGPNAAVVSQVGFGPVTANPEYEAGWSWGTTPYNLQVGNNDEYQGQFSAPPTPGSYRYAYRFSLDNGTSWTYCDINGAGSNAGLTFELGDLGVLTVTP